MQSLQASGFNRIQVDSTDLSKSYSLSTPDTAQYKQLETVASRHDEHMIITEHNMHVGWQMSRIVLLWLCCVVWLYAPAALGKTVRIIEYHRIIAVRAHLLGTFTLQIVPGGCRALGPLCRTLHLDELHLRRGMPISMWSQSLCRVFSMWNFDL